MAKTCESVVVEMDVVPYTKLFPVKDRIIQLTASCQELNFRLVMERIMQNETMLAIRAHLSCKFDIKCQ